MDLLSPKEGGTVAVATALQRPALGPLRSPSAYNLGVGGAVVSPSTAAAAAAVRRDLPPPQRGGDFLDRPTSKSQERAVRGVSHS